MLASSTSVTVTIRGKGGHGAWPHRTIDPIVLAALVVVDLQTIVSREIDPTEPAVVTVGSIHGGTKHNIIPDEVKLQLTLRTFSEPVRQQLIAGIRRRVEGLARAHQAPEPTVEVEESTPPTINTPALVERIVPAFDGGPRLRIVSRRPRPSWAPRISASSARATSRSACSGSGRSTPARLEAARAQKQDLPALHSSKYYPDPKPSIETGIRAMTGAIIKLLPGKA